MLGGKRDPGTGRGRLPVKPAAGEAFSAQPKPLAIVRQELERRPRAITEHVDRAVQRILPQRLATQSGQAIDPFAEVNGLQREEDAAVGAELEHQWVSRNVWSKGTSEGEASLYEIRRRVPSARWTSTSAVGTRQGSACTSTKGREGDGVGTEARPSASRRRLSAWGVRPNCLATRVRGKTEESATACAQSD